MIGYDILNADGQFVGFTQDRGTAEADAEALGGFAVETEGWYYDGSAREYRPLRQIQGAYA